MLCRSSGFGENPDPPAVPAASGCGGPSFPSVHSGVFTMSKKPVRVAVTGAAGQIGYALLFR
ncbi:MAG: hypothetical protein EP306_13270, partial [Burkholderiales bacterium]